MAGPGFQEAHAPYVAGPAADHVGEVRRFGPAGPAYEVIGVAGTGEVAIEVIQSGERLHYPVAELVLDPLADTVP